MSQFFSGSDFGVIVVESDSNSDADEVEAWDPSALSSSDPGPGLIFKKRDELLQ